MLQVFTCLCGATLFTVLKRPFFSSWEDNSQLNYFDIFHSLIHYDQLNPSIKRNIRALRANGKSNRTIARRIDVSESTVERITKQMNEMEYKRRKSGSDRPLKITHKLRKSFKKLALLNKRDGSRKLAPKVLKVNSIQVYQREQRGQLKLQ